MIIKDRRIGRFALRANFVNEEPVMMHQLMQAVVIWRAEITLANDEIEYFATSDLFKDIGSGPAAFAPYYRALFSKTDGFEGFEETR